MQKKCSLLRLWQRHSLLLVFTVLRLASLLICVTAATFAFNVTRLLFMSYSRLGQVCKNRGKFALADVL